MANKTEFSQYSTNTHSLLFDGYLTFNPSLPPSAIVPDIAMALGAGAQCFLDTDGRIVLVDGPDATAAGARSLKLDIDRIIRGTVTGAQPTTATAKVVDLQTKDIDYGYSNPGGITQFFVDGWHGRDQYRYKADYIAQYPSTANLTPAQRVTEILAKLNSDPTAKYTGVAIPGTSGSGSGQAGAGIRLTSKTPGEDYTVTAGDGFGPATIVTPSQKEFGTSLFLQRLNLPFYQAAFTGKTFKTVMFTYETPIVLADHGMFPGRSVGNNAKAYQDVAVFIFFEVGAADALLTQLDTILQGKATPVTSYDARGKALNL